MLTTEGERGHVRSSVRFVLGVDEAGRGCMAGPVGVAATLYRLSATPVRYTVQDSKTMSEAAREATLRLMCEELIAVNADDFLPHVIATGTCTVAQYQRMKPLQGISARLVDVAVINQRNILNATLEGMAAVCSELVQAYNATAPSPITPRNCAVLIDGNRTPWTFLPEEKRQEIVAQSARKPELKQRIGVVYPELDGFCCTTVVQGDGTLLSIGAASILAKVARDTFVVRVMHVRYPLYGFDQHKGYCTAEHTRLLRQHGPCDCHRRDYAPVRAALGS